MNATPSPSPTHLVRSFPEDSGSRRASLCGRFVCRPGYDPESHGTHAADGRPLASGVSVKVIEEVTCQECLDVRAATVLTPHQRRAARLYDRITANVDDFHAGRVSYDEFSERARALWADVAAKKMTAAVLKVMRGKVGVS